MALTLDATVGGATSNSYITVADADSYFDGRLNDSNWTGSSAEVKAEALVHATKRLDHEVYVGFRDEETQSLKWPRSGVLDEEGFLMDNLTLPTEVPDATCELALVLLSNDDFQEHSDLANFEFLKVDEIEMRPRFNISKPLPSEVRRLLRNFLRRTSRELIRG